MCSATSSGHVITCTTRRWVISGRLYCFQHPPAEGRREACKPSTDPTSRITNVRINRTAAHRSIFRPVIVKPPRRTPGTPSSVCHRQDEKSRRKGTYTMSFPPAPPCCTQSTAAPSRHRQDKKSRRKESLLSFPPCLRRAGLLHAKCSCAAASRPAAGGRGIIPPRRTGSAP